MVQESTKHLKIIHLYYLLLLIYLKSNAQCVNSTNITLQFGTNTFIGELCQGGLNISTNTCPAYQNFPAGTIISPGYSSLNRNRTNTMIDYSNVHLVFEDNFDGSSIDENKWDLHTDFQPGGYGFYHSIGMEYFSLPGDVTVSSGNAHLWAKYHSTAFKRRSVDWIDDNVELNDNVTNLRDWHYSSGYLYSQQYFKHGVFEIRAKIPDITNVWPALWLFGSPGEIDLLEMTRNGLESTTHSNNTMYFTYHCTDYPISPLTCEGKMTAGRRLVNLATAAGNFNNFATTWHTFKLLWSENMMQWVIDNQVIFTEYQYYASQDGNLMFPMPNGSAIQAFEAAGFGIYYNRAFPQRQMKLILSQGIINSNVMVDPDDPDNNVPAVYPNQGATDLGSFPKEFEIDYVKVYALNSCASDINFCNENTRLRDLPSYIHGANVTIGGDGCHDVLERESDVHEERYYKRNVEVKASNSIHLKSGFHVAEKALFHASIEPCINTQRLAPEPIPGPINISSLGLNQVGDILVGTQGTMVNNEIVIDQSSLNPQRDSVAFKEGYTENYFNVYPSPANDQINIQFILSDFYDMEISIYDSNGKYIGTIFSQKNNEPNNYNITFDAKNLSSGIYSIKFLTQSQIKIMKLVVCNE